MTSCSVRYGGAHGGALAWYALDDPNSPELDKLAEQFHLHPLHIEDCRSHGERVKIEQTPDYIFVILMAAERPPGGSTSFCKLSVFVGQDFCVSVADMRCASLQRAVQRAREGGPDQSGGRILYELFDSIADSYVAAVDRCSDQIDDIQDKVLDCAEPSVLQELFNEKRDMIQLRRILVNTRDVSMMLQRNAGPQIEEKLWPFFRDVYDHVARSVDLVDTLRDQLTNTLDVYLSSVANRTNEVVKVLTVLSTVALPALVISSIYGMNIKWIPFADSPHGIEIVLGMMAGSTAILLIVMRLFRWL